jgi:hypothetical protein
MTENPEKKIIVDEDWKTQVEREREAASKTVESAAGQKTAQAPPNPPLPPADLTYLATMLNLEAMACLGLLPGKTEKNLPIAKHLIDLLEVLQQKTEGNRTPEESDDLENLLYQARMAYVQAAG